MFLWQRTVRFAESYSGSEYTSPWSFDDENDAKYLWIKFSSSIIDMRFVELVELIDETFASSYVFSKTLHSHLWSITSSEFWLNDISSLIFFIINCLIFDTNTWLCISFYLKILRLFNEILV